MKKPKHNTVVFDGARTTRPAPPKPPLTAPASNEASNTHNIFSDLTPDELQDLLENDPTLSAFYYLDYQTSETPTSSKTEESNTDSISVFKAEEAFDYGYLCAVRKGKLLDTVLFLYNQEDRRRHIWCTLREIMKKFNPFHTFDLLTAARLHFSINQYILKEEEFQDTPLTQRDLQNAFCTGYKTAFIINNKYDRSLTMYGHELYTEIISSMLLYKEAEENSRQAAARKIAKISKAELRQMITQSDPIGNDVKYVEIQPE